MTQRTSNTASYRPTLNRSSSSSGSSRSIISAATLKHHGRTKVQIDHTLDKSVSFLVQSPKDGELLGLEWGMILQVSNIIFPDENSGLRCQYYKGSDKRYDFLLDSKEVGNSSNSLLHHA